MDPAGRASPVAGSLDLNSGNRRLDLQRNLKARQKAPQYSVVASRPQAHLSSQWHLLSGSALHLHIATQTETLLSERAEFSKANPILKHSDRYLNPAGFIGLKALS